MGSSNKQHFHFFRGVHTHWNSLFLPSTGEISETRSQACLLIVNQQSWDRRHACDGRVTECPFDNAPLSPVGPHKKSIKCSYFYQPSLRIKSPLGQLGTWVLGIGAELVLFSGRADELSSRTPFNIHFSVHEVCLLTIQGFPWLVFHLNQSSLFSGEMFHKWLFS